MIDTDKYEGHTPAPWELITNYSEEDWDNKWVGSVHLFTTLGISFDVVGVNETDVQLMKDSPLLLAEVKRLREKLNAKIALITDVDTMIGDKWNVTQDDWNELVNKHYGDDEE